ncbi:hypothetical protein BDR07DRAFT_1604015 [Suillus spraguei]|nr:hypothetical protein BDR07DRAFT_1604015 [Suillus spraguei]
MQNDIIELSDSDTDTNSKSVRSVKKESTEILHGNYEVTTLKAKLAAQNKLVAEQGKELNKLRKENKQFKNERDVQIAEVTGLQDELKNILRQLDDEMVKNLSFNMIKLNSLKSDVVLPPNGIDIKVGRHQDIDQDMSDSFVSDLPTPEDELPNAASLQSQTPGASGSARFTAVKPEPEGAKIAVVIKSEHEHEPDLNAHVTFVKSEDGKFDIWNLEHLRLGPPVIVEERFHVGFRRAVISNALGGNWQSTFVNWQGPTSKSNRYPYMALKRSWNPHLPLNPGEHGVVFSGVERFEDGTLITGSVDVVISGKPNEWVYFGSYETSRSGEITPHQLHLLPPLFVRTWVEGTLKSQWGKNWVEDTNAELVDKGGEIRLIELTTQGLREALSDGRLVIGFTVMKCVGFRAEWFDQFLHYQAHRSR